jgi:hypothetical protein
MTQTGPEQVQHFDDCVRRTTLNFLLALRLLHVEVVVLHRAAIVVGTKCGLRADLLSRDRDIRFNARGYRFLTSLMHLIVD